MLSNMIKRKWLVMVGVAWDRRSFYVGAVISRRTPTVWWRTIMLMLKQRNRIYSDVTVGTWNAVCIDTLQI